MILHITNDYSGSTVYKNLIKELDNNLIPQIVYTPVKNTSSIGKNKVSLSTIGSEIIYSHILNKHLDRIFYRKKIKKIFRDVEKKVDLSKVTFIHAHTWYSDGGVAYLLNKKYKIPYLVTVRSTDVNTFYKYMAHERNFGKEILKSSKNIILLTPSLQKKMISTLTFLNDDNETQSKLYFIPNGVDDFWIDNAVQKDKFIRTDIVNALYVGTFIKRKKLLLLQRAIIELNKKQDSIIYHLHIVGNGGQETSVQRIVKEYDKYFSFYGRITNKEELLKLYRMSDIFAMTSINETFGLVYVEALSQGLPLLYTENEGIDGIFDFKIGERVSREVEIKEIMAKIEDLIKNYDQYNIDLKEIKEKQSWNSIAKDYVELYKKDK